MAHGVFGSSYFTGSYSVVLVPNINDQTSKINSRDKDQSSCKRHRIRILFLWSAHPTQGSILSPLQSQINMNDPRMLRKMVGGYSCQPADGRPQPGPPAASEELISIRLRLWYWLLLPIHGNTTGGLLCWDKVATLPACKCVICKWFRVFLSPSMVPNWTEHKQCWVCSRFKLSKLKKKKKKVRVMWFTTRSAASGALDVDLFKVYASDYRPSLLFTFTLACLIWPIFAFFCLETRVAS